MPLHITKRAKIKTIAPNVNENIEEVEQQILLVDSQYDPIPLENLLEFSNTSKLAPNPELVLIVTQEK